MLSDRVVVAVACRTHHRLNYESAGMTQLQVVFYQRKRRPKANFSLEFIFEDVRNRLKSSIRSQVCLAPCYSNGLFRRLWIAVDAWFRRGQVTHVTGDINFAVILMSRSKSVLTILDCGFLERTNGLRRWLLHRYWLSLPVRSASCVTTISEAAKETIIHNLGFDPGTIVVIPVAVSDSFQPVSKEFNRECPRILQVGTASNKNLERAVEALQGISCKLVIVGQVNEHVRELIDRFRINTENYVNLGSQEILQQYVNSDMILFASTYEGFGMPIMEAQRIGRAVVTSSISSMPEVAGAGACFVDPLSVSSIREGILKVIQDDGFRERIIADGFVNSRRFDAEEIASQYLKIYKTLAAR